MEKEVDILRRGNKTGIVNDIQPQTKWNLNSFSWANENRLPGFGRLLGSWLNVHRDFSERGLPYLSWDCGHNEGAQVGFLGNAAVLIGGLSVEESGIKKGPDQNGRLDLWLRLCPPTSQNDFLIEAKIEQYLGVIDLNKSREKIDNKMKAARKDAQRLKRRPEEIVAMPVKIVAMAFLSLLFQNENLDSLEQNTNDLISSVWDQSQSQKDLDAIGAIWMGAEDFRRSRQEREKVIPGWKNHQFGMVLLASRVMT